MYSMDIDTFQLLFDRWVLYLCHIVDAFDTIHLYSSSIDIYVWLRSKIDFQDKDKGMKQDYRWDLCSIDIELCPMHTIRDKMLFV